MRHPIVLTLLCVALLAGAATASGADKRVVSLAINGHSEAPVDGAPQITYVLRFSYRLPGNWPAAKAKPDARVRSFGPINSCRIKATVTVSTVTDVDETAVARVTRLLPASGRALSTQGTRDIAAYRVVRAGSKVIVGMLVRPATGVRTALPGKRVWLQLTAVGTPDPKTECHAGGPRSIADQFGTMFATAGLGGFQTR